PRRAERHRSLQPRGDHLQRRLLAEGLHHRPADARRRRGETGAVMKRALLLLVVVAACKPDLGAPPSLMGWTRYVAIMSDRPEALPGETVELRAVIASPDGDVSPDAPAAWAICTTPKPVSVDNAVSDDCVFEAQDALPDHKLVVTAML